MRKNKENDLIFEAYQSVVEADKEKLAAFKKPCDKVTKGDVIAAATHEKPECEKVEEEDYSVDYSPGSEVEKHGGHCMYAENYNCTCKDCPECQKNYDDMVHKSGECDHSHDETSDLFNGGD